MKIPYNTEGKNLFLVRFRDCWADEFDVEGFCVMSDDEIEVWKSRFKVIFDRNEVYTYSFGTNEEIDYSSFDQFISNFSFCEISEEQAETLKTFGFVDTFYAEKDQEIIKFGDFPMVDDDEWADFIEDWY